MRVWEDRKQSQLTGRHKATYQKLSANLDLSAIVVLGSNTVVDIIVAHGRPTEGDWAWKYRIPNRGKAKTFRAGNIQGELIQTLIYTKGRFQATSEEPLPVNVALNRVIVGLPRTFADGTSQLRLIGSFTDNIALSDQFRWSDGRHIFNTNTRHQRSLVNQSNGQLHVSVEKWHCFTPWRPDLSDLWNGIWQPFLSKRNPALHGKLCIELE